MTFYKIAEWPYVSIVDPRTGENMVTWSRIDAAAFPTLITEFLSLHPSLESPTKEDGPPRKKVKTDVLVEMDEEAQMAAAIKASLAETLAQDQSDSGSDFETFSDDDSNPADGVKLKSSPGLKNGGKGVKNGAGLRNGGEGSKNSGEGSKNGAMSSGDTVKNGNGGVSNGHSECEERLGGAEGSRAGVGGKQWAVATLELVYCYFRISR